MVCSPLWLPLAPSVGGNFSLSSFARENRDVVLVQARVEAGFRHF